MSRGQRHEQLLRHHGLYPERAVVERRTQECDLDFTGPQSGKRLDAGHDLDSYGDTGVQVPKVAQDTINLTLKGHGVDHSDCQRPYDPFARCAHPSDRGLGLLQDQARRGQKEFAGLRQADRPLRSGQKLHPKLDLELSYLLAQRRLRHVKPVGGAPKVELLGNGNEVSERSQFH